MILLICLMSVGTILFSLSLAVLVMPFSSLWPIISAWTLGIGVGYSLIAMTTGILAIKAPKGQYDFMLGIQLFATIALQTIVQIFFFFFFLNLDLPALYYTTAGLAASCLVAFLRPAYAERKGSQLRAPPLEEHNDASKRTRLVQSSQVSLFP